MTVHDVKVRRAMRMVNDALSLLVMADDLSHECAMASDKLLEAEFWIGQIKMDVRFSTETRGRES